MCKVVFVVSMLIQFLSDASYLLTVQEEYWQIPASMSPEQINTAASLLKKPTGSVASPKGSSELESERRDSEEEPDHMTNGGDVMQSPVESSEGSESERELTKAEAFAALRRSRGEMDDIGKSKTQSSLKNKPNREC